MKQTSLLRPVVDISMTILLLLLMAYQTMPQMAHAALGILILLFLLLHSWMNRRFYPSLRRGHFPLSRLLPAIVDILLPVVFLLNILCGVIMVVQGVPLLRALISPARNLHLMLSHWALILAALHLGFHGHIVLAHMKRHVRASVVRRLLSLLVYLLALVGLYEFYELRMVQYLFFLTKFAFLDFGLPAPLVIGQHLSVFIAFAVIGYRVLMRLQQKGGL